MVSMPLFDAGVKGFEGDRAEAAEGRMATAAVVEHHSLVGYSFNQRNSPTALNNRPPSRRPGFASDRNPDAGSRGLHKAHTVAQRPQRLASAA